MTWKGLVPLTSVPRNPTLDLAPWVGIQSSTFKFLHYDGVSGEFLGELTPYVGGAALSHNTGQTVKRSLSLQLGIEDTSVIDPIRDRIWVYMVIDGTDWPLGKYMFTDDLQQVTSVGNLASIQVVDEMFRIDQGISRPFVSREETVPVAVPRLLEGLDVQMSIDAATDPTTEISSPIGTGRGQILNAMAIQGGYFTPWMDNRGGFRMINSVDPSTAVATIDFDTEQRVFQDSVTRSVDILTAPNRFFVVNNGSTAGTGSIVGTYDVPASAPHSIQNRGFVIPSVTDIPVLTERAADAAARAIGVRSTITEQLNFTSPADPRHDSYDVIIFGGEQWLEVSWLMQLTSGGAMTHSCIRVYL